MIIWWIIIFFDVLFWFYYDSIWFDMIFFLFVKVEIRNIGINSKSWEQNKFAYV